MVGGWTRNNCNMISYGLQGAESNSGGSCRKLAAIQLTVMDAVGVSGVQVCIQ